MCHFGAGLQTDLYKVQPLFVQIIHHYCTKKVSHCTSSYTCKVHAWLHAIVADDVHSSLQKKLEEKAHFTIIRK